MRPNRPFSRRSPRDWMRKRHRLARSLVEQKESFHRGRGAQPPLCSTLVTQFRSSHNQAFDLKEDPMFANRVRLKSRFATLLAIFSAITSGSVTQAADPAPNNEAEIKYLAQSRQMVQ